MVPYLFVSIYPSNLSYFILHDFTNVFFSPFTIYYIILIYLYPLSLFPLIFSFCFLFLSYSILNWTFISLEPSLLLSPLLYPLMSFLPFPFLSLCQSTPFFLPPFFPHPALFSSLPFPFLIPVILVSVSVFIDIYNFSPFLFLSPSSPVSILSLLSQSRQ